MNRILQNKIIILFAVIIAWFPVVFVSFVNDDFQILGYHTGGSILSIFAPFWKQDISVFYWRPVGNMLHPAMQMLFGFNYLPYRLLSIVLYACCCITLSYFMQSAGVKKEYANLTAILFAVLPSHEYQIAWIADQGESLVTIFLLLAFIFYFRNKLISLLLFAAAILTKESAFAGVMIPLIAFIASNKKIELKTIIRDIAAAFILLVIFQIYRYYVPGGTIFSSSNLEGTSPLKWIINLFLFIPISFVQPEFLEYLLLHPGVAAVSALFILFVIYVIVISFRKMPAPKRKIFYAGIIWFLFFIVPALPAFMRWYAFTASAGLALSLSIVFESIESKRFIVPAILVIVVFCLLSDMSVMWKWKYSGDKMKTITASLKYYKAIDTLYLFAVPEKIESVPLMKLGIAETVTYASGKKNINVFAPLRIEMFSRSSEVKVNKVNDSTYKFTLTDGRFKNREGRSYTYVKPEQFTFLSKNVNIEVNNGINKSSRSEAKITIPPGVTGRNMYYNGNVFISF